MEILLMLLLLPVGGGVDVAAVLPFGGRQADLQLRSWTGKECRWRIACSGDAPGAFAARERRW